MKKLDHTSCEECQSRGESVFCKLETAALSTLTADKNANTYKKGQNLFLEGNPPFGLYCIRSGKIKITRSGPDGGETLLRIAGPGDLVGHQSLFSNAPFGASATVLEEAKVCFIPKGTIQNLVRENPTLSLEMISRLSQEMGAADQRIASLSQKNLRERFAELLLLLKESYGKPEGERIFLDIKLTREDMASMVGAASENLIRLVTEFKNDGLLEQEGKNLYIKNLAKIEEYAQLKV